MENCEAKNMPLLGDAFPQMTVQTTHGEKNLPGDYAGKWFILFSHPSDFTPVCTTEFAAFEKLVPEFNKLNCDLIGLSVDQVFSHIKWVEWIKDNFKVDITFPIIADTGAVAAKLGLIHPGKGTTTVRAVFIVDDKGIVRLILYYPQEVGRNMEEILRVLKALQVTDTYKVATPANWPNNDILGKNHVIIPAPKTMEEIQKRKETAKARGYEYLDWWLCHKELDEKDK
ncbi:peroxiredoxin (alkyl hydroperoxide reductase subunit C) [Elusimicrobium simillimum]|uniref:peroxiredoxin n=1 Tax=Elusimicrobium simillimum TaxID=3143438 RepID=UPI003C6F6E57